jgi:hypothetical protein
MFFGQTLTVFSSRIRKQILALVKKLIVQR